MLLSSMGTIVGLAAGLTCLAVAGVPTATCFNCYTSAPQTGEYVYVCYSTVHANIAVLSDPECTRPNKYGPGRAVDDCQPWSRAVLSDPECTRPNKYGPGRAVDASSRLYRCSVVEYGR